jgi:hypothetical protein
VILAVVLLYEIPRASAACSQCLEAGAASTELRLPPGTPLAGYGAVARRLLFPDVFGRHAHAFWFKPHVGALDPLMARALVLESGSARLIWLSLDVVAVDRVFTSYLAERLQTAGSPPATLIVSASHTHSGPGAYIDSALMGFVATDRRDHAVRDALVASVLTVVRRADADKRHARLGAARVTTPSLTVGRLARPVDAEMIVVKVVTETGTPIAALWNYAIHGTALGPENLHFSGDIMGLASRLAEADLSIPVLFVNGAVADVSPRRHGHEGAAATSRELTAAVRKGWDEAKPSRELALRIQKRTVHLPSPYLSLRNCLGRWVPRSLTMPLGAALPQDAELIAVGAGPVAWVAVPGELQSALGHVVKRSAGHHWPYAFIAGLSNDYLGYFVAAQDYDRPSYVTCANLYGASAGDDLARAASELLAHVADDRARSSRRSPSLGTDQARAPRAIAVRAEKMYH